MLIITPTIIRFLSKGIKTEKKLLAIVTVLSSTVVSNLTYYDFSNNKGWSDFIIACLIYLFDNGMTSSMWVWLISSNWKVWSISDLVLTIIEIGE